MKTAYNVGIYCRLSREDLKNGKRDMSLSIENQQTMLEDYVQARNWHTYSIYVDDDVSGTTFNRPGFNDMMDDIGDGKINCVVAKDLSRFGRNRIESAIHREKFLELGVRFIAIHDDYDGINELDPDKGYDVATPIKEMVNEMYAAEVSRKVRKIKKSMAEQGKFANSRAPYGYRKSSESKYLLVVDEDVSHNIVRIYEMYLGGKTARAIADVFNQEGIQTANDYYYDSIGKPNPFLNYKNKWGSATIMNIIKNPAYYGAVANGKRAVRSFKNKTIVIKPADEWIVVEGTHEPIINKERWLEAQRISERNKKQTVRRSSNGEVSIFAGIIKCVNCGNNLVFNRKINKNYTREFFRCSTYTQKGKDVCPVNNVDYYTLYQVVLAGIQEYAVLAVEDEERLVEHILKLSDVFNNKNLQRYEKSIRESNNRVQKIDKLLQNLYEDKVSGEITVDLFKRMSQKYEEEQSRLISDVEQFEKELGECRRAEKDLTGWISCIKECLAIKCLTRAIVIELIDRIDVSETYDANGEKSLDISINYKFGLPTLSQQSKQKNRAC